MIHDNRFEFEKVERPQAWLNLVGRGSKWRAGVGYLPPTHASALKSGKTGVLGADGEPDISPQGRKLTDEEKAKIAKTDKEMQEAEIGKPFESKKYQRAVAKAEKSIEKDKVETGIILDGDGREIARFSQGHPSEVELSESQWEALEGNVFTHNHPNGQSLSVPDIVILGLSMSKEVRAVGSNGLSYSARVKKQWNQKTDWDIFEQKILNDMNRQDKKVRSRMMSLLDQGKIAINEAEFIHHHLVNREYAKLKTNPIEYNVTGNPEALANLTRLERIYDGD